MLTQLYSYLFLVLEVCMLLSLPLHLLGCDSIHQSLWEFRYRRISNAVHHVYEKVKPIARVIWM